MARPACWAPQPPFPPEIYLAHTVPRTPPRTADPVHRVTRVFVFCDQGGEDVSAEVVVRGVKSDELRVRAPEGELPQEGRALRGLRLPGSPDEHLLSSETSLQFCLEEAQGSFWH